MSLRTFYKDPDAVLDYAIDWSSWLATGETISDSEWDAPTGITVDSDSYSDTETVVWLSGGTAGAEYDLVNHVVTSGGREDDRTIRISIRDR